MEINKHDEGANAVFTIEGRLDAKTSPQLDAAVAELPAETDGLILDCAGLAYISSMGLRSLHMARKRFAEGGGVTLRKLRPALKEIIEMSGFSMVLKLED